MYKECTFFKDIDQHIIQIPIPNDENHTLNMDINADDDWISLTSSEVKIIDQNSRTTINDQL